MIVLKKIPKDDPRYIRGMRFTMNVNDFPTFNLTYDAAKELRDNLTKMLI